LRARKTATPPFSCITKEQVCKETSYMFATQTQQQNLPTETILYVRLQCDNCLPKHFDVVSKEHLQNLLIVATATPKD